MTAVEVLHMPTAPVAAPAERHLRVVPAVTERDRNRFRRGLMVRRWKSNQVTQGESFWEFQVREGEIRPEDVDVLHGQRGVVFPAQRPLLELPGERRDRLDTRADVEMEEHFGDLLFFGRPSTEPPAEITGRGSWMQGPEPDMAAMEARLPAMHAHLDEVFGPGPLQRTHTSARLAHDLREDKKEE